MVTQFSTTAGVLLDGVLFLNGTLDLNGVANALILDADGDTHGDVAVTTTTCDGAPMGYVSNSDDCDEYDAIDLILSQRYP